MVIFLYLIKRNKGMSNKSTPLDIRTVDAYNNTQFIEIWPHATAEIKTNFIIAGLLIAQRNCSLFQAFQQIANDKEKVTELLNNYQALNQVWDSFFSDQK